MKHIFIIMTVLSVLGCHNYRVEAPTHEPCPPDTFIFDTTTPRIIFVPNTIYQAPITIIDTFIPDIINPWPGFIIDADYWHGDSLERVWMQWGENGPWHQYVLNDTLK